MICTFGKKYFAVMGKPDAGTRRDFFKAAIAVITLPLLYMWGISLKRLSGKKGHRQITLNGNLPEGVSFTEDVIIINRGGQIKVFSAFCTHLGCEMNNVENDEIVCPCHGSRFDLSGEPVKGPAVEKLKQLPASKEGGKWIIEI